MSVIERSPFKDAVGPDSVPKRGSGKGTYDHEAGMPVQRDGGMLPELYRDDRFGEPSKSGGPIKDSPFKDAVE